MLDSTLNIIIAPIRHQTFTVSRLFLCSSSSVPQGSVLSPFLFFQSTHSVSPFIVFCSSPISPLCSLQVIDFFYFSLQSHRFTLRFHISIFSWMYSHNATVKPLESITLSHSSCGKCPLRLSTGRVSSIFHSWPQILNCFVSSRLSTLNKNVLLFTTTLVGMGAVTS